MNLFLNPTRHGICIMFPYFLDAQTLKSDEGRELRSRHQSNVKYLRNRLMEAGLPVVHTPSHIIPVHVSQYWLM